MTIDRENSLNLHLCQAARYLSTVFDGFRASIEEHSKSLEGSYSNRNENVNAVVPRSKTSSRREIPDTLLRPHDALRGGLKVKKQDHSKNQNIRQFFRLKWSINEHHIFLRTIDRSSRLSEIELLHEIHLALGGNRSEAQIKSRLRTLLAKGDVFRRSLNYGNNSSPHLLWATSKSAYINRTRRRNNWTAAEDSVVSDVVSNNSGLDENEILQMIVLKLNRKRTWFQVRRHFKQLIGSGRVTRSPLEPFHWYMVGN